MKALPTLLFLILVLVSLGCKKENSPPPGNGTPSPAADEVWMQNNVFSPASITVKANTTVKWINKDATAHTVTSNTNAFDSGNIGGGGTYSHQFTTKGSFPYVCTFHPGMTGTVVVQ